MSSPAPLRLVVSRAEVPFRLDPTLAFRPAPPLAPRAGSRPLLLAALAAFTVHAATLAFMMAGPDDDLARSAGAAEDLILIEGIPVELVESLPTPEAPPIETAPAPDTPPEAVEETPPEEPIDEPAAPMPEPALPPEPPREPNNESPLQVTDEALPPAQAETGALPARPEAPPPVAETPDEAPPPVAEETPPPEEVEPPAPDPDTVPPPRPRPDRPEPPETPPEPPKPAAPPSASTAASSAARSGGAGGGGAAETAGTAADSAYRARVAAQLARKKFYPNAARRDRLTGRSTVRFTLDAAGRVTAVKVVRSAGSRILDDAAVEMVRRAAPYPPIPDGLGSTIAIQAPIGFELPR